MKNEIKKKQIFHPSLSENGQLRNALTSQLMPCLEALIPDINETIMVISTGMMILDGAVIVNIIKLNAGDTFDGYSE